MQNIDLKRRQTGTGRPRAGHLLALGLASLLAAGVLSLWQSDRAAENRARIANAESEVAAARMAVENFRADNPEVSDNTDLRERISELESERQTELNRLRNLIQTSGVRGLSYYDFLSTLARQRIDGAWLTRFRLENDEDRGVLYVTLRGLTEDTELLPEYLAGLRSGGLQSVSFNNLTVNRQTAPQQPSSGVDGPLFRFQLSTRTDPAVLAEAMGSNESSSGNPDSAGGSDSAQSSSAPPASRLPLEGLPPGLLNSLMQGGGQ